MISGTDHGSAAPLFLVGGKVTGGLIGGHPDLSELEGGGLKHHTDFRRLYAACMEKGLPIGVAQNVHVSLVMLPEEARWLRDDANRYWMGELKLKLMRKVFAMQFRRELKKAEARVAAA